MYTHILRSLKEEKLRRKDVYSFTHLTSLAFVLIIASIFRTVFVRFYCLRIIILIQYRYSGLFGVRYLVLAKKAYDI